MLNMVVRGTMDHKMPKFTEITFNCPFCGKELVGSLRAYIGLLGDLTVRVVTGHKCPNSTPKEVAETENVLP